MMVKELKYANGLLFIIGAVTLFIPLFIKIPNEQNKSRFIELPTCYVKAQTGTICSTCGLTRSIVYLYRGDWANSKAHHPYGYLFFFWAVLQLGARFLLIYKPFFNIFIIDSVQLVLFLIIFSMF